MWGLKTCNACPGYSGEKDTYSYLVRWSLLEKVIPEMATVMQKVQKHLNEIP